MFTQRWINYVGAKVTRSTRGVIVKDCKRKKLLYSPRTELKLYCSANNNTSFYVNWEKPCSVYTTILNRIMFLIFYRFYILRQRIVTYNYSFHYSFNISKYYQWFLSESLVEISIFWERHTESADVSKKTYPTYFVLIS